MKVSVLERRRRGRIVFSMRWRDRETGIIRERRLPAATAIEAESLAEEFAISLESRLPPVRWSDFRTQYEAELVSVGGRWKWAAAVQLLAKFQHPTFLHETDARAIEKFERKIRMNGYCNRTAADYAAAIRSALLWAADNGLLERSSMP